MIQEVIKGVEKQPAVYNVDKVVGQLEAEQQKYAAQALETDDTDEVITVNIKNGLIESWSIETKKYQKAGMGMEYCSRPKESELESTLVVDTQDSITGQEESKED